MRRRKKPDNSSIVISTGGSLEIDNLNVPPGCSINLSGVGAVKVNNLTVSPDTAPRSRWGQYYWKFFIPLLVGLIIVFVAW